MSSRTQELLRRECGLDEGDLTCFEVYAFPTLSHLCDRERQTLGQGLLGGGTGTWLIRDASAGVVRRGRQSASAVANAIAQPSDWAKLMD